MIGECTGVLQLSTADHLTAAELWFQYLACARVSWGQTAALCALIANANRDPQRQRTPFRPADFNPLADPSEYAGGSGGIPIERGTMQAVGEAWTGQSYDDIEPAKPLNLPPIERRK